MGQAKETELQPLPRRKLSRNARRLLKRILRGTSEDTPVWAEGTEKVAKALKVDRSTVVRIVKRLRCLGVLRPLDITGGRGRVSQYAVDREKARALFRQGYWELAEEAEPGKTMHKEKPSRADLQDQVQRDPSAPLGVTAVKANLQTLSAPGSSLLIYQALPEWIADKARGVVETLKDTFQNPSIWNLLGLHCSVCRNLPSGRFRNLQALANQGQRTRSSPIAISVGLGVYFSWRLLD